MKKRICLLMAVLLCLSLLPAQAFAAEALSLYLARDDEAGLYGQVLIALADGEGTIYLPGSADAAALRLCFDGADSVTLDGQTYRSGEAPIPAPGQALTYAAADIRFTLHTEQGSGDVAALFVDIDESRGTIYDMNHDRNKETSCYGSLNMDGEDEYMSIKGRGNSTWTNFDKKPYNLTIYKDTDCIDKKSVSFIDGEKSKKWSILANAKDSTLLRNRLGLHLADELGIGFETRFVDVWINGEYRGNYLMTPKNDYQAPKEGYMLEIDNTTDPIDPTFTVRGFSGSRTPIFTVKDNGAGVETSEIKSYIQAVSTALLDKTSDDYLQYIDVESWARMCLVQEFYKNTDVVSGSLFMYRNGLADTDLLYGGPVWDLDVAMGRAWAKSVTTVEDEAQVSGGKWYIDNIQTDAWYQVLCRHPEITARMYELYNEYKAAFDSLPAYVAAENEKLQASADMNFVLWDVNRDKDHNPYTCTQDVSYGSGDYQVDYIAADDRGDYMTNLNTYVEKRLLFLSDNLTVAAPAGEITGNAAVASGEALTLTASLTAGQDVTYRWQSSADGEIWTDVGDAATYTVAVTPALGGTQIRCIVRSNGERIETAKIAQVRAGASTILAPVTVTLAHTHDYVPVVTAPTCEDAGFTTYTCSACGDTYTADETAALGHTIVDGVCTRCGFVPYAVHFDADHAAVTVYHTQTDEAGAAENPAYARDGDTGAITGTDGQVNFSIEPENGYEVESVTVTPAERFKNFKLPADTGARYRITKITGACTVTITTKKTVCPHDYQAVVTPPTCTAGGYTTYTCTLCGDAYVADEVAALGHDLKQVTVDATCTKAGSVTTTCTRCNYQAVTPIPAPGHAYTAAVTAPTCTQDGYTTYTCTRCGDRYTADETDALGHAWDEGTVTKQPTEAAAGVMTYTCTRCNAVKTEAIPMLDHVHRYQAVVTAPTCTAGGYTTYTCACGDTYTADETDALGHAFTAAVTAPTCTQDGYTTYTCTRCGYRYTADKVDALGHDLQQVTVDATCTAAGSVTTTCTRCDYRDVTPIPAPGHAYTAAVTAPTCTAGGFTTYTCDLCGDTYTADETAALGHDFQAGVCTRCGKSEACDGGETCPAKAFADAPAPTNWAHKGIDYCVAHGLMNGVSEDRFAPAATLTRGQLVTILYRLADSPAQTPATVFRDVTGSAYYFTAVAWANAQGIVTGYTDGTFKPEQAITREQIATILYRYAGKSAVQGDLSAFPDDDAVSPYARDAMVWATQAGLITGVKTGDTALLSPQASATRAQLAAIIMRYLSA